MSETIALNPVYLPVNLGHGNARRVSLEKCKNELVAVMDADDIAYNYRFEKQLEKFQSDSMLGITGGQIAEFTGSPKNITGVRKVPESDREIKKYMKKRCPFNQVTVMFKKSCVLAAGGYRDWFWNEDYYLWIRMALAGIKFANLPDILVNVRVGDEMSARRGGWRYFKSEAALQTYMLNRKLICLPRYCYNVLIRFVGEVVVPSALRTKLFHLMRKKYRGIKTDMQGQMADWNLKKKYPPFSVAMCVYKKDNAKWFDAALGSVIRQTVKPDEIVLVVDGPVSADIENVIDKYMAICRNMESEKK